MREKIDLLKRGLSKYRKTVIRSLIHAGQVAVIFSWFPALYKIKSLGIGEYPEESAEIIIARLQAMRLVIIRKAVIEFLLLTLIFFIILLIYWFKRNHNINLIQKIITEILKKD